MSMLPEMMLFEIDGRFFYDKDRTKLKTDSSGRYYLRVYENNICLILAARGTHATLESYCFTCKFLGNALEVFLESVEVESVLSGETPANDWIEHVSDYQLFEEGHYTEALRGDLSILAWRIFVDYVTPLKSCLETIPPYSWERT